MAAFQPSANTAAAVGLFTTPLAIDDQIDKPLIFGGLALPFSLGIIAAAGNLKHTAHRFDRIFSAKTLDHPVFQLRLLPASDRRSRRSSTCIRSSIGSLFRFCSSLSASTFVYRPDMTAPPVVVPILQQEVLFSLPVFGGMVHCALDRQKAATYSLAKARLPN